MCIRDRDDTDLEVVLVPSTGVTIFSGSIEENAGTFTYSKGLSEDVDYMFYKVRDSHSESEISLITLNHSSSLARNDIGANKQTVAVSDSIVIMEDTPTSLTFIGAEVSDDGTLIDETGSLVTITSDCKNGSLGAFGSAVPDGQLIRWSATYTPDENFSGLDSIGYVFNNPNNDINGGSSEEAYLYLTINSVNDPPQSSAIFDQTVSEGGILNIPLSISSLDPDNDLSYSITSTAIGDVFVDSHASDILTLDFSASNYNGTFDVSIIYLSLIHI